MNKLNLHRRADLVRYAADRHSVDQGTPFASE